MEELELKFFQIYAPKEELYPFFKFLQIKWLGKIMMGIKSPKEYYKLMI